MLRCPSTMTIFLYDSRHKVRNRRTSRLVVPPRIFRLVMKAIFDVYLLWPFGKTLIIAIAFPSTAVQNFTVSTKKLQSVCCYILWLTLSAIVAKIPHPWWTAQPSLVMKLIPSNSFSLFSQIDFTFFLSEKTIWHQNFLCSEIKALGPVIH